jgi:hypothetical protein
VDLVSGETRTTLQVNEPEPKEHQGAGETAVAFEQSRLDHCIRLFNEENSRREGFDKTAQYYLAFITAFLGALFLKVGFLQTLKQLLAVGAVPMALAWIVYASIVLMLLSLFLALVCVLECIRVRRYKREFPSHPAIRLFAGDGNKEDFLRETAITYVATIEANFEITERKGLWILRASLFVLVSVLSLFLLLATITYLMVR